MKRIAYILFFMFFISCHTKKTVAEKVSTQTYELVTMGTGLSAVQQSLLSYQLSTISPDTPLEYTHEVKGRIVERITLKGGSLSVTVQNSAATYLTKTATLQKSVAITTSKHKHVQRSPISPWWLLLLLLAVAIILWRKLTSKT
jgi:lipoprotein